MVKVKIVTLPSMKKKKLSLAQLLTTNQLKNVRCYFVGLQKQKVAVDTVEEDTCHTFVMHEEDHTLGNALRYIVMKNPDTEFCGYSVPHPSENKINFRIQSKGPPATGLLKKGLTDLSSVCQHVLETFEKSVEEFKRNQRTEEPMDS